MSECLYRMNCGCWLEVFLFFPKIIDMLCQTWREIILTCVSLLTVETYWILFTDIHSRYTSADTWRTGWRGEFVTVLYSSDSLFTLSLLFSLHFSLETHFTPQAKTVQMPPDTRFSLLQGRDEGRFAYSFYLAELLFWFRRSHYRN